MTHGFQLTAWTLAISSNLLFGSAAPGQSASSVSHGECHAETCTAEGTFDVELTPEPEASGVGRMLMEKRFDGDLVGTSKGQMLTWRDDGGVPAAYVAIERVTGTLDGRSGSFVLVHQGTMTGEEERLAVTVVPGSGTDELDGLSGKMTIDIDEGAHSYEFEYAFDDGG